MAIHIQDPGMATTVQDLGRYGYAHLGISPAGAADALSFRLANRLAGNDDNAPALEMTLIGAALQFDEATVVAVAGAPCAIEVDGAPARHGAAIHLGAGSMLKCGQMTRGARAYLAIQGGIDVPLVMGSASTFLGAQFGGWEGRRLRRGDALNVHRDATFVKGREIRSTLPIEVPGENRLRVTRGPQADWFEEDAFRTLLSTSFTVTDQCGRTGLRLHGERVVPRIASQLLTDGIALGAIQIPADGQPIILFVDQQTTGGYPKIANVIAADMHCVGQLRARDTVRFAEVSIEEAVRLLREQELWLKQISGRD